MQSIEELWSKESIKARDKRGISIEISESIGDLAHDIYILPMKVRFVLRSNISTNVVS